MTDILTIKETRRLIKKLQARIFLTVTQADDLLRLCDGLDIAEEMRFAYVTTADCDCIGCTAAAKWDRWLGNASKGDAQ